MSRILLATVPVAALLVANLLAADEQNHKTKQRPRHVPATLSKVDRAKGEITLKYPDAAGKEHEKTFRLTEDVRILDETGRVAALDVFESGNEALILEEQGRLKELRRPAQVARGQRLSDAVQTLIEMTDCEEGCVQEVQRIYDMLRKLDTAHNGKIDPTELKAERERILENRVKGLMDRLDSNKDGKISPEEAKGLIKEHFNKLDSNRDGFVDYQELLQAARAKHQANTSESKKEKP
jgi:Ca2+-binding EF-hand superfamily protein